RSVFNVGEDFPNSMELRLDAAIPVIFDKSVSDSFFFLRNALICSPTWISDDDMTCPLHSAVELPGHVSQTTTQPGRLYEKSRSQSRRPAKTDLRRLSRAQ